MRHTKGNSSQSHPLDRNGRSVNSLSWAVAPTHRLQALAREPLARGDQGKSLGFVDESADS